VRIAPALQWEAVQKDLIGNAVHRRAEQDKIGIAHRVGERRSDRVDRAEFTRLGQIAAVKPTMRRQRRVFSPRGPMEHDADQSTPTMVSVSRGIQSRVSKSGIQ